MKVNLVIEPRAQRRGRSTSGIALIIVLIVMVVLGILAAAFAYAMKVEMTLARHATSDSELDWAGLGGVQAAGWVLGIETQESRGLDSLKLKSMGGPGDTNSILYGLDLKNYIMYGPLGDVAATLSFEIVDLDRKFNINTADEVLLKQAMTIIGVDAAEASTAVSSILDWRDRDSNSRQGGAESEYYESLDPPYFAKDGPIDDLTELLLVKGITPAMYWGSGGGAALPLNRANIRQGSVFDEPIYAVGLVDLFTPISGGRPNSMTVKDANVLQVIPEVDASSAESWISFRNGPDGSPGTIDDIVAPLGAGIQVPGMSPQAVAAMARYCGQQSRCFEARITVDVRGTKREYVAILRRNGPKDVQTLNVYWK